MLTHPTLDQLRALRLEGMIEALEEQRRDPHIADLRALFVWAPEADDLRPFGLAVHERLQHRGLSDFSSHFHR